MAFLHAAHCGLTRLGCVAESPKEKHARVFLYDDCVYWIKYAVYDWVLGVEKS